MADQGLKGSTFVDEYHYILDPKLRELLEESGPTRGDPISNAPPGYEYAGSIVLSGPAPVHRIIIGGRWFIQWYQSIDPEIKSSVFTMAGSRMEHVRR